MDHLEEEQELDEGSDKDDPSDHHAALAMADPKVDASSDELKLISSHISSLSRGSAHLRGGTPIGGAMDSIGPSFRVGGSS